VRVPPGLGRFELVGGLEDSDSFIEMFLTSSLNQKIRVVASKAEKLLGLELCADQELDDVVRILNRVRSDNNLAPVGARFLLDRQV